MATVTRVLQHSPRTVDRLERDAISRSFDKGQQAGDEELAEFIKYHRQHWQEKEQAATGKPSMTALCVRKQLKQGKKLHSHYKRA